MMIMMLYTYIIMIYMYVELSYHNKTEIILNTLLPTFPIFCIKQKHEICKKYSFSRADRVHARSRAVT